MPFNLLTDSWLPVVRLSGMQDVVRPCDIADLSGDPILALDFPRPDWNAALTEFLIGLCALARLPADAEDWADGFEAPLTPQAWLDLLEPYRAAFDFDGDGPRAFQDFDPLAQQDSKPIAGLLIDAPGENALRNNSDLFIKRGGVTALSLPYAAAALITLQTYAPTGGVGHRTSMRGGGPLTTLLAPRRRGVGRSYLWDRVWANLPQQADEDAPPPAPQQVFPWLSPTRISLKDAAVTPDDALPLLAFFACPRRIRLDFADDLTCSLGGPGGRGAAFYRTQNYGACYQHWRHPLSPYYRPNANKTELLPRHPHSGPSHYGDWIAWWGFDGTPAEPLRLWRTRRERIDYLLDADDGAEAFGYDMDNMKARQWLSAALPWIPVDEDAAPALKQTLSQFIAAADLSARALARCAKYAVYGQAQDDGYRLPENLPLDALSEIGERLWHQTEGEFRQQLRLILARFQDGEADASDLKLSWLTYLRRVALRLFDSALDCDGLTNAKPRRLLWARDRLSLEFADHTKAGARAALGLAVSPKQKRSTSDA